jgi:hypothetical protein
MLGFRPDLLDLSIRSHGFTRYIHSSYNSMCEPRLNYPFSCIALMIMSIVKFAQVPSVKCGLLCAGGKGRGFEPAHP